MYRGFSPSMPAVLKEAVEKSYEDVGWDLTAGVNKYAGEYGHPLWPCFALLHSYCEFWAIPFDTLAKLGSVATFADVCRNVRTIIDTSEYDAENKGAYKGSLVTRLKSLSNGINGMVFTDDEIPAEVLFDSNVIADLSRVGSMETKALIMGLLVLKLQEHRMTQGATNAELQHVTVLEEAHNLLKCTSKTSLMRCWTRVSARRLRYDRSNIKGSGNHRGKDGGHWRRGS